MNDQITETTVEEVVLPWENEKAVEKTDKPALPEENKVPVPVVI